MKGLELDRATHSATPCDVARKDEGGARRDESKGENRCGQGQTQIMHERDDAKDGDDMDRPQMTMPTTARHPQVVTSRGTVRMLHEPVSCHKTDQIPSSRQCRYVVR